MVTRRIVNRVRSLLSPSCHPITSIYSPLPPPLNLPLFRNHHQFHLPPPPFPLLTLPLGVGSTLLVWSPLPRHRTRQLHLLLQRHHFHFNLHRRTTTMAHPRWFQHRDMPSLRTVSDHLILPLRATLLVAQLRGPPLPRFLRPGHRQVLSPLLRHPTRQLPHNHHLLPRHLLLLLQGRLLRQ